MAMGSTLAVCVALVACSKSTDVESERSSAPNVLLIVADDLNWDSVGVYGSAVTGTTPRIDGLAAEGMRFEWAHVNVSVCQPSRHVLLTGRYSHRCGGEGFSELRIPGVPLLPGVLRDAGYRVGAFGKLKHSTPYESFEWDVAVQRAQLGMGRSPECYAKEARSFILGARELDQPFFLMANSHDPHRPFYGMDSKEWYEKGELSARNPSRLWEPGACPIPGFLPELVKIGHEVAAYYSSVRRCDDTVGALLDVLDELDAVDDTIVVFLSDNGMAFPFAKAGCYPSSTRTPWIVRWPERVARGSLCESAMISGVDLMPTLLDALGIPVPADVDGRSFLPLLDGEAQSDREHVFTQYGLSSSGRSFPVRAVYSKRFGYVYNLWSDGERLFERSEHKINGTFQVMVEASSRDSEVAARTDFLLRRTPQELYDLERDPACLVNLVGDPNHRADLDRMRSELETWMVEFEDPALEAFRNMDRTLAARYMAELEAAFAE